MRWVRHRDSENKRLFPFNDLQTYNDCDELLICLSERSLNIILNALHAVEEMRTRVWTTRQGDLYQTASEEQFQEFRQWTNDVYNQLGSWVMCNEKLERIAVALESLAEAQEHSVLNLTDIAEVLGIEPSEDVEDLLEAFEYISTLLPGLPQLTIPKADIFGIIGQMRTNGAYLQLLRDMSLSLRAQAVAQGGIDAAGLYDTMGETAESLIVKAGFQGKAYWVWRWLSNDQIPGWTAWLSQLGALVFGSIRGATYDLVEAVENLDLAGIAGAIQDQTLTTIVNCNSCSTSEIYDHLSPDGQEPYVTVEDDATWDDEGEPPVSDDTTWTEVDSEDDRKCQASHFIIGWLQAFYGHSDWNLSTTDNLITLSDKFAQILADIPAIGPTLNGLSSIIGQTLAYLSGGSTDIFETVNEKLTDRYDDLVCGLYDATSSEGARNAVRDIMIEEDLNSLALNGLMVFLTMNNIMANLFYENELVEPFVELESDTGCSCGTAIFMLNSFNPAQSVTSGSFEDGEETTVVSGVRNYFGSDRAGINLNVTPYDLPPLNRRCEVISITNASGNDFYVTLVDAGSVGPNTVYSPGMLASLDEEISDIQITRPAVGDTSPFTIVFRFSILP